MLRCPPNRVNSKASLLKRQRNELHQRAAAWFAERDSVLHAEHLGRAGDPGAANAYLSAAREQLEQYRPERALELVHHGLDIAQDSESFALRCLQGELLRSLASVSESMDAYRRAQDVASDDIDACRAQMGIAEALRVSDAHEELIAVLDDAEATAKTHALSAELSRICQLRTGVYFLRGESDVALRQSAAAVEHAVAAGSPALEAQAVSFVADAEYSRGRMISAYHNYDRCIELAREHGLGQVIAANLSMRGTCSQYMNDVEPMMEDFREAAELAVKTHAPRAEMIALTAGAVVAQKEDDSTEGEQWLRWGLDISRQFGSRLYDATYLKYLGQVAAGEGRREEAEQLVEQALDILRGMEGGMASWGPHALGVYALAAKDPDKRRVALKEGEALLDAGSMGQNYFDFYETALEVCLEMAHWDEVERYAQAMEDYARAEPLPRSDFFIARARTLAVFGRGDRGPSTIQELQRLRDEAERVRLRWSLSALEEALSAGLSSQHD